MQSVLEQEALAWLTATMARLGRHDRVVLLGVALCLVPFPPANLAGLLLTCMNLVLVQRGKLSRSELPLLCAGVLAILAYAALWTSMIAWAMRSGEPRAVWSMLTGWVAFLSRLVHGAVTEPLPSTIHNV
ncbi:MAG: hypothetical protein ACREFY_13485 [Acetobacteraceae bacterium]